MAITIETIERLPEAIIKELAEFPTTILSDAMEKSQTMHAEMKPVFPVDRISGSAITARSIVADYLTRSKPLTTPSPGTLL